jgi:hypothetical protein
MRPRPARRPTHLLAIGLEDTLLEHAGGEDLEHPAAFLHALFLGHDLLFVFLFVVFLLCDGIQ